MITRSIDIITNKGLDLDYQADKDAVENYNYEDEW